MVKDALWYEPGCPQIGAMDRAEGGSRGLSEVFEGEDTDAFSSIISLGKQEAAPQVDRPYFINRQRTRLC